MMYRQPYNLIIQLEDSALAQVTYYWIYYGKPCTLTVMCAKTDGLVALTTRMDNPDAGSFVFMLCERLKARMFQRETKRPLGVQEVFR